MPHGRIRVIDNSKAIAILLVVVGHVYGFSAELILFVFSFHMSLFFFLSGMLLKAENSLKNRLSRIFFAAMGPYAIFFAISYAYWLATRNLSKFDPNVSGWAPMLGFVSGRIDHLFVNPALWFLPCIFLSTCLTLALLQYAKSLRLKISFLIGLIAVSITMSPNSGVTEVWTIGSVPMASAFMLTGSLVRPMVLHFERLTGMAHIRLAITIALITLTWVLAQLNPHVDWSHGNYGVRPFIFLCTSVIGTLAVLLLGSLLPTNRFLSWLAMNTIILFPTHLLVFNFFRGFGKVAFGMSTAATREYEFGLIAVPLSLLVAYIIALYLPRLAPRAFPGLQQ